MPSLSVIMIVKNEADCLAQCLESVRAIADEIIVGDTGSTDDTKAIAEANGARVIDVPWNDDFATARNATITAATGDWLLHMDADEVLDADGAKTLRELIDADGNGADAIEVTLANYCNQPRSWRWVAAQPGDAHARGHSGYLAVPLLRVFRNGRGFEYREAVHENITDSVMERGGTIGTAPIVIHHYGYAESGPTTAAKSAKYLELCRKKAEQRPDDPKAWHDLAEQALSLGKTDEAMDACEKALALDEHHLGAGTTKATILLNEGKLDEAKSVLTGLEEAGHREAHIATGLAAIALREGRMEEALAFSARAVDGGEPKIMGMLVRARILDAVGGPASAREQLQLAQQAAPALREIRDRLEAWELRQAGEELANIGDFEGALRKFVEALRLDPEDPVAHNNVGVVSHQLGQTEKARECFERALKLAPGMEATRNNLELL